MRGDIVLHPLDGQYLFPHFLTPQPYSNRLPFISLDIFLPFCHTPSRRFKNGLSAHRFRFEYAVLIERRQTEKKQEPRRVPQKTAWRGSRIAYFSSCRYFITLKSVRYNSSTSIGLATWASMPASKAAATSSRKAFAVMAMIGISAAFGQAALRINLVA